MTAWILEGLDDHHSSTVTEINDGETDKCQNADLASSDMECGKGDTFNQFFSSVYTQDTTDQISNFHIICLLLYNSHKARLQKQLASVEKYKLNTIS
jgi:hypothetical protein